MRRVKGIGNGYSSVTLDDGLVYITGRKPHADEKLDYDNPPDIWSAYLQGRIDSAAKSDQAIAAYQAAIKKEPAFNRARFAMVQDYQQGGKADEARKAAEELVKAGAAGGE